METVFLPDECFLQSAKMLIQKAEESIDIASFKIEMSNKPRGQKLMGFFLILAEKAAEGVNVRVITNKRQQKTHIPNSNTYAIKLLKQNRIYVRQPNRDRICHAKILIVDKKKAIIGSHNLSVRSCSNNLEVSVLILNPQTAATIDTFFDHVWDRSTPL